MPVILCAATVNSERPRITLVCGLRKGHSGKHKATNARKVYRW
jgi:hypothetical protein